eukprot:GHVU01025355.1.p1 GENE.GHVU01025355.1~~GHVU01025355.1.p1  ORF type:complete len:134 (+),score=1.81 GHVU01025355.1:241-642(+)
MATSKVVAEASLSPQTNLGEEFGGAAARYRAEIRNEFRTIHSCRTAASQRYRQGGRQTHPHTHILTYSHTYMRTIRQNRLTASYTDRAGRYATHRRAHAHVHDSPTPQHMHTERGFPCPRIYGSSGAPTNAGP